MKGFKKFRAEVVVLLQDDYDWNGFFGGDVLISTQNFDLIIEAEYKKGRSKRCPGCAALEAWLLVLRPFLGYSAVKCRRDPIPCH